MKEEDNIETDNIADQNTSEGKSVPNSVTHFSKYLVIIIFITLLIVGFWSGFKYWQTNSVSPMIYNNEDHTQVLDESLRVDDGVVVFESVDKIFAELSSYYPELEYFASDIKNNDFAWQYHKNNSSVINTDLINGRSIYISDLSFQDSDDDYESYVFRFDAEIQNFFVEHNFKLNLLNSFSLKDGGSSQLGFRQENSNIICVRNIEDDGSEFLTYSISCGYLSEKGQYISMGKKIVEGKGIVKDNNLENTSVGAYLAIEDSKGDEIFVLYHPYKNNEPVTCLNKINGTDFVVGDEVSFKGEKINTLSEVYVKTNLISTCESEDFYLEKINQIKNFDQDKEVLKIPECETLPYKDSVDDCYMQYAQSRKDTKLCDFIFDTDEKKICLKYFKTEIEVAEIEIGSLGIPNSIVPVGRDVAREVSLQVSGATTPLKIDLYQVDKFGNKIKLIGHLLDDGENGDLSKGDNLYNGIFEFGPYAGEQTAWYMAEVLISENQKLTTKPVRVVATNFPLEALDYSKFKTIVDPKNHSEVFENLVIVAFVAGTESSKVKEIATNLGGDVLNFSMIFEDTDVYTLYFPEANTLNKLNSVISKLESYKEVDFADLEVLVGVD